MDNVYAFWTQALGNVAWFRPIWDNHSSHACRWWAEAGRVEAPLTQPSMYSVLMALCDSMQAGVGHGGAGRSSFLSVLTCSIHNHQRFHGIWSRYLSISPRILPYGGGGPFSKGICYTDWTVSPYPLRLLEKITVEISCHVNTLWVDLLTNFHFSGRVKKKKKSHLF